MSHKRNINLFPLPIIAKLGYTPGNAALAVNNRGCFDLSRLFFTFFFGGFGAGGSSQGRPLRLTAVQGTVHHLNFLASQGFSQWAKK